MKLRYLTLFALAVMLGLAARPVFAHGFGERYDLPLPLGFFAVGGAAAVVLSFVLIGLFVRGERREFSYPRFNLCRFSPARTVFSGPFLLPIKVLSGFLFFLVIATGLFGDQRPVDNLAPTFVWVIWWVGMGFTVAMLGNLWALLNPWKIVYGWLEGLYRQFWPDQEMTLGVDYPSKWGLWPAVALFFVFAWLESAFSESAVPKSLSQLIIFYSVITWLGMFMFGRHQWLRHGEVFSVVFGFLARFSVTEVRVAEPAVCRDCYSGSCLAEDGSCVDCYECAEYAEAPQFNLRPPAVGLHNTGVVTPSVVALVVLLLASVTFDGLSATPEWVAVQTFFIFSFPGLTYKFLNGAVIANTLGLIGVPLALTGVYWFFSNLMFRAVGKKGPLAATLVAAFAFSLIPIALAYNYAHFLGLLLIQGQQIIPLMSDPFGFEWNLFGTGEYLIDIGIIGAKFLWVFSVAVIVVGHMVAVYLAHLRATALYGDRTLVMKSQLPMLVLMVLYTTVSLWIVSRPITE